MLVSNHKATLNIFPWNFRDVQRPSPALMQGQMLTKTLFFPLHRTSTSKSHAAVKILQAYLTRTNLLRHAAVRLKIGLLLRRPCCIYRWNFLLVVFARLGLCSLTLRSFALVDSLGLPSDSYSFCTVLTVASSSIAAQIHGRALRSGWISSIFVCGALIDSYARSLEIRGAAQVLDEMGLRNTVCVNSLLNGYLDSQRWAEGFCLFRRMPELSLKPDGSTLSAILRICAEASAASLGLQVHAHIFRVAGFLNEDAFVTSSLMEMYGKCGLVGKARLVLELVGQALTRDVVLWTCLLNAYGRNGQFVEVVATYELMLAEGIKPDEIALLAVLSACNHSGDVNRGLKYFESIVQFHEIVPGPEHYGCVVDMLCRVGNLEMAWKFATEMMLEKDYDGRSLGLSVWVALLSHCRNSGNVEMGNFAAKMALELDPNNAGVYAEWSNLYACVGLWNETGQLRESMKVKGLRKEAGCSRLDCLNR